MIAAALAVRSTTRSTTIAAAHGVGISEQHRTRLFERFYRVAKSRSRGDGGTGLGLAIVRHVAINHGGEITLDSTPGVGSTFRLHIPVTER